jgi:hypothetical protein
MSDLVDMDKLAQEESKGTPPPLRSAISDVTAPSASEEAEMRQLLGKVTMEELHEPVKQPQLPVVTQQAVQTTPEIPAKFQKPDGTVDEEKLKASSEQIQGVIEQKKKSIDEMLAEYKANEEKLRQTGQEANNLKQALQERKISEPPAQIPSNVQGLTPQQIHANLLQQMSDDPIGAVFEIAKVVSQKEGREIAAPALEVAARFAEQQRDADMRQNLLSIAEKDVRIQNPELYAEFVKELNSDPAYFRLKNPQRAAWNEVKDRLRLGEPTPGSAQPSQASSPVLGHGVPPSVSSLPQPMSADRVQEAVRTVNPFSEEGKKMEEALIKQMAEQAWR